VPHRHGKPPVAAQRTKCSQSRNEATAAKVRVVRDNAGGETQTGVPVRRQPTRAYVETVTRAERNRQAGCRTSRCKRSVVSNVRTKRVAKNENRVRSKRAAVKPASSSGRRA